MQIKTKIVSCHTYDSKPVKQEINGTVILPPLVFPGHNLVLHQFVGKIYVFESTINVEKIYNGDYFFVKIVLAKNEAKNIDI